MAGDPHHCLLEAHLKQLLGEVVGVATVDFEVVHRARRPGLAVEDAFAPLVGVPSWLVRKGHGSFVIVRKGTCPPGFDFYIRA